MMSSSRGHDSENGQYISAICTVIIDGRYVARGDAAIHEK